MEYDYVKVFTIRTLKEYGISEPSVKAILKLSIIDRLTVFNMLKFLKIGREFSIMRKMYGLYFAVNRASA